MSTHFPSEERVERRTVAGTGVLVLGLGLLALSAFMFFENVQISGGFLGSLGWGPRGFGWSLLPLLFGIAWIVWRPRGLGGWALALLGVVLIGLEVLSSLTFYFRPVSLITVLLMLGPGAVGAALVLKNL
jgi:hypothetical protein